MDEARWMAVIAPCHGLICDPVFLNFLDSDGSGSIRSEELKLAWKWLKEVLKNHQGVTQKSSSLVLQHLNLDSETGRQLHATAKQIFINLNCKDTDTITLEQTRDRQNILSAASCNGDGIIPPNAVEDPMIASLIRDIMATVGSERDLNGEQGVSKPLLDKFIAESQAFLAWHEMGLLDNNSATTKIMPRGEDTAKLFSVIQTIELKLDEYFLQCQLLLVDPSLKAPLDSLVSKAGVKLDFADQEAVLDYMKRAVLAESSRKQTISLKQNINPQYLAHLQNLFTVFFTKKTDSEISIQEWQELKAEFAPYRDWMANKSGALVKKLGAERVRFLNNASQIERLYHLIKADAVVAQELSGIALLEKTILFQRWLMDLLNNFISFSQLFEPDTKSLIQAGQLIMDGRHFDLTIPIIDRTSHRSVAVKSNICTIYLKIYKNMGGSRHEKEIATAVTAGSMNNLYVGKLGIFTDHHASKWDALIVDIITHPVSMSESMKMPFVKLGEFLSTQAERFSSSRYGEIEQSLGSSLDVADKALTLNQNKTPVALSPFGNMSFLMLGSGLSLAALGSSFAYIVKALSNVSFLHVFMVLLSIVILMAGPIVILSYLKLRRRDLGLFLEAGGWAINGSMPLTHSHGKLFTKILKYTDQR